MALLKCRHCEIEIDSNARKTRCPGCGQLFPFACAVCEAPLRPPFPVFDDERYLNDDNEPLCPEHFQRQCPKCETWFSADENPGFFLCKTCMEGNELPQEEEPEIEEEPPVQIRVPAPVSPRTIHRKPAFNFVDAILSTIVFVSVVAVVVILGWQIFVTIRTIVGF
ncbi:MAG: hypothetical protein ABI210_03830 [Abditibacteriaceae bacterium]